MPRAAVFAICAAFIVVSAPASAEPQEAPLIPRALLYGNPERDLAKISPDGAFLSWLAPRDGVLNVWIAPASDPGAARPITQETSRPIQRYSWSADGRYVLYAQDTAGDENFRLYAVDPRSGASRSFAPDRASRTDIYAVSPRKPNVVIVGVNDRDPDFFDIYAINLQTGERTKIFANTDGYDDFTFDNDLNLRLAYKDNPGGGGVLMRRAADGQWSPFQEIAPEDSLTTQPLSFNAAGDTLFWISSEGRDRAALRATNLDTGASRIIGENSKADVARALFDRTTFEPIAYDVDYLRNEWIGTSPAARRDLLFLSKRVKGDFNIISQTSDSRTWIVRVDSATSSPADYIFERAKRRLVKLFDERPGLNAYRLSAMEAVEIPSRDGLILPSYLTLPAAAGRNGGERTKQPGPLVLSVHGGPWARDEYGYQRFVQWLADRGYAVLQVNYRGSTGFGKAFINAGDREWGAKMQDDLVDAVDWAERTGIADPKRVAIVGGSYGGYATLAGLAFTPEEFACGVDIVGPSNLETLMASFPSYWKAIYEEVARRIGDPRTPEGRQMLEARSPLSRADQIRRPLLIGQGANDPRVKQTESNQIVAAMQAHQIPVTYVLFPDEGHGFARPENNRAFYAVTEAFLSKCLGGRFEPFGSDLEGSSITVPVGAENILGLTQALARSH